jgi:hypothetical protein
MVNNGYGTIVLVQFVHVWTPLEILSCATTTVTIGLQLMVTCNYESQIVHDYRMIFGHICDYNAIDASSNLTLDDAFE